ncbi:MAG: hypothetical protein HC918_00325 [Oscillatoriales cyanobacterium SM2_1_8]|nr:hypothetical protein [Oscillatoriales cyanobacterium SM2_1_8]
MNWRRGLGILGWLVVAPAGAQPMSLALAPASEGVAPPHIDVASELSAPSDRSLPPHH